MNGPVGVAVESGGLGLIGTGVPPGPGRVTLFVGVGVAFAAEQPARTSAAAIRALRIILSTPRRLRRLPAHQALNQPNNHYGAPSAAIKRRSRPDLPALPCALARAFGVDRRCWVPEAGQRLRRFVTRRLPK